MPRRAWDDREAADRKGAGWNHLGLRGERSHHREAPTPYPEHDDPAKALLGEPRPGESALDRKVPKLDLVGAKPEPFRIDWSKMSATHNRVMNPIGWTGGRGDIDEE